MSVAGTPLGEESSGHLSPGTSDVITIQLSDWHIDSSTLEESYCNKPVNELCDF